MRAIITVIGKDQVGIIAAVTGHLAQKNVNVLDISQTTLLGEIFSMVLLADVDACPLPFGELADGLTALGEERGLIIRTQREDTFQAMHRV